MDRHTHNRDSVQIPFQIECTESKKCTSFSVMPILLLNACAYALCHLSGALSIRDR
jgi:hypothetical protein